MEPKTFDEAMLLLDEAERILNQAYVAHLVTRALALKEAQGWPKDYGPLYDYSKNKPSEPS